MPAATAEEPRLRVVDAPVEDAPLADTGAAQLPVQDPWAAEAAQQAQVAQVELAKAIAFEAALFGISGATAGILAATSKRRPRGALLGSMGGVGVYGLYRASFGGKVLPMVHRVVLGTLGVALLGGSGYLAFFHKPKGLGRLPKKARSNKPRSRRRGPTIEE
jgi:hypothetical protein